MKKSKSFILFTLCAYLILLGHLSIPAVNDFILANSVSHSNSGSWTCSHLNQHVHEHSHKDASHEKDDHHCIYCSGHNKLLEFTVSHNHSKLTNKTDKLITTKICFTTSVQIKRIETNQVYLQNVFKPSVSKFIYTSFGLRAPPVA